MIKLELEEYCDKCPNFEPEVAKINVDGFFKVECNTTIFCEHRHKCNCIAKYMKDVYKGTEEGCMVRIPEPVRR